jgi:hypothetical protein
MCDRPDKTLAYAEASREAGVWYIPYTLVFALDVVAAGAGAWVARLSWGISGWGFLGLLFLVLPVVFLGQVVLSVLPTAWLLAAHGGRPPREVRWAAIFAAALGPVLDAAAVAIALTTGAPNGC